MRFEGSTAEPLTDWRCNTWLTKVVHWDLVPTGSPMAREESLGSSKPFRKLLRRLLCCIKHGWTLRWLVRLIKCAEGAMAEEVCSFYGLYQLHGQHYLRHCDSMYLHALLFWLGCVSGILWRAYITQNRGEGRRGVFWGPVVTSRLVSNNSKLTIFFTYSTSFSSFSLRRAANVQNMFKCITSQNPCPT